MTEDNKIKTIQTKMEVSKDSGEISDFTIKVEDGIINVYVKPIQTLKHIDCNFIVTPTGCTFQ